MFVECPRCHYQRKPSDLNPDWECPSCGVVYAKALARLEAQSAPPPVAPEAVVRVPLETQRRLVGFLIFVVIALLFRGLLGIGRGHLNSGPSASCNGMQANPVAQGRAQAAVILYGTDWCPYCARARSFLASLRVPYSDLDVEKDAAARSAFDKLNGDGYPLIWVDGQVLYGLNEGQLCAELIRAGVLGKTARPRRGA